MALRECEGAAMTEALGVLRGRFGRVALVDMDTSLVSPAHPHCHVILKVSGRDQVFTVENEDFAVREDTAVLVNTWEQHHYAHHNYDGRTVFLALYIEPSWLKGADSSFASCETPAFFDRPGVSITDEIRRYRSRLVQCIECEGNDNSKEGEELIFGLTAAIVHQFANWRGAPRCDRDATRDFPSAAQCGICASMSMSLRISTGWPMLAASRARISTISSGSAPG